MPMPLSDPEPMRLRPTARESLLTPEEIAARRRLRVVLFVALCSVLLGVFGWFTLRPIVRAIKGWQARRIAVQAMAAIDRADWKTAREKIQDAYALRPSDPAVIRTTAVFLTRVGAGREAVSHWKVLASMRPLAAEEERDFATAALAVADLPLAQEHLAKAWPAGREGSPADWWLGIQVALYARQGGEARDLAERLVKSPASTDKYRLGASQVLLSMGQPEAVALGWKTIESTARGDRNLESLEALLVLARRQAATFARTSGNANSDPKGEGTGIPSELITMGVDELIFLLEHHPLAKAAQKLLIYDLRSLSKPAERADFTNEAVRRFAKTGDPDDLAALASWLYSKGDLARIQDILPLQEALRSRALFLQYLDTLGATRRWQEIKDLIQEQRFPLDPILQQMYLARCTEQLGQAETSRLHWGAAIEMARGNAEKLVSLGQYAERVGSLEFAQTAYQGAYSVTPQSRPICEALLRVLERRGQTVKMLELLRKAVTVWPADAAMRNDVIYLSALLGEGDPTNTERAHSLVQTDPLSLPHRVTLALSEYKQGHTLTALDAFKGITLPATNVSQRFLAVYATVLWAADFPQEARAAAQRIQPEMLLPEERDLVQPILKG